MVISNGVINLSADKPRVFAEAARGASETYGVKSISLLAVKA